MEILIIGTEGQASECRQKFGAAHTFSRIPQAVGGTEPETSDIVFDFDTPNDPSRMEIYRDISRPTVFFDTSLVRLSELLGQKKEWTNPMFGFCGLPTFVNRDLLEIALRKESDRAALDTLCAKLGTAFRVVTDQAGMVTPRVICMIINEAYYTLEEGTATREDIDLAMKLGTNYPWGPFEWGERIGLKNVVEVLKASEQETADPRYQVCPLLIHQAQGG